MQPKQLIVMSNKSAPPLWQLALAKNKEQVSTSTVFARSFQQLQMIMDVMLRTAEPVQLGVN